MRGALQKISILLLAFVFSACTGGGLGGNLASPLGGGGPASPISQADGSGKGGSVSGNTDGNTDGSGGTGAGSGSTQGSGASTAASVVNGTSSGGGDGALNVAQNFAPGGTVGSQSDTPDINTDDPCYKNPYKVSFSGSSSGGGVNVLVGNKGRTGGGDLVGGTLRMCDLGEAGGDPLQMPGADSFNCRDFTVGTGGLISDVNVEQNKNYLFVFLPPGTSSGGTGVITRDQLGSIILCKTQAGPSAYTLGAYQFNSF